VKNHGQASVGLRRGLDLVEFDWQASGGGWHSASHLVFLELYSMRASIWTHQKKRLWMRGHPPNERAVSSERWKIPARPAC